jgi:hypothetical protein
MEKYPYLLLHFYDTYTYYSIRRIYQLSVAAAPHLTFRLYK